MERIKSEIKNLIDEWRLGNSAEAKYRCEAYSELLEFINSLQEEPVNKDLEEAACEYDNSHIDDNNLAFKAGAKWGMKQAEVKIQAESIAVAHGCSKESLSNDLEEAADNYVGHAPETDEDLSCFTNRNAFIAGAKWQKEQCQKTIELAEDHAYLAGQEKMIDKACEFIETYPHLFMGVLRSEVIEDFKNYTKGE